MVNYGEYDKLYRKGVGVLFGFLPNDRIEYMKTIARWLLGKDHLASPSYLWKGQYKSIVEILNKAAMILPNSTQNTAVSYKNIPVTQGIGWYQMCRCQTVPA